MSKAKLNSRKDLYLKDLESKSEFYSINSELISFNLKYYRHGENNGEAFENWEQTGLLSDLNNKLHEYSKKRIVDLVTDKTLEIYGKFPTDSLFNKPNDIVDDQVNWGRFRLTGERRLIGFIINSVGDNKLKANVFYIVFLDKNHQFAPSRKKHT